MTDGTYRRRKKRYSLYLKLLLNILLGVAIAGVTYLLLRLVSNYCIENFYMTEELQEERRKEYIEDLQNFADKEGFSSDDTDKLALWAGENPYLYILVYKNDELFFSSDMNESIPPSGNVTGGAGSDDTGKDTGTDGDEESGGDEDSSVPGEGSEDTPGADTEESDKNGDSEQAPEDSDPPKKEDTSKVPSNGDNTSDKPIVPGVDFGSLGIGSKVDREELIKQAEASGMHTIMLEDGPIFAAVAEYSEMLYYDLFNFISLAVGIFMLGVVLILYFRRIVVRIKRLESDVNIVSHINMNHKIVSEGEDEISILSRNVEDMRNSILDNLEKEREARNANTELITAMSHDIRTPLTVLLGYIDMLKNYEGSDEVVKNYVAATERTALRLKDLSDDMFKYSLAFGDTEEEMHFEEYDAKMLFDQLISEHILLLTESGYNVVLDNRLINIPEGTTVYTDPQNLMRVVDNIFQNLYKYADKEKPVLITAVRGKNEVTVSVRNSVLKEQIKVESNGIGLKSCERLCKYIANDFSYEKKGEFFTVRLSLALGKTLKPKRKGNRVSENDKL